jgi:predicted SnoaL-like aldol condensation-catalyzing enzyme
LIVKDIIELFRRVIERGFNTGDLSVADEVCAQHFIEHQYLSPTGLSGPETLKQQIMAARREVSGQSLTIEEIVAQGDKVWARMVARGTDPPSGQTIVMNVMDVCRFADGLMVEHWGIISALLAIGHESRQ